MERKIHTCAQGDTMRKLCTTLILVIAIYVTAFAAIPDLEGRWALLEVTSNYWQVPLAGERQRTGIVVGSVEIEQDGMEFVMKDLALCKMWVNAGTDLVKVEIPQSFVSSVSMSPATGRIYKEDDGYRIDVPWFVLINGARLSDPKNDPLPTIADDPRVYDQDKDGLPGVTTRISIIGLISGEAYFVQRVRKSYRGWLESENEIHGLLSWEDEQNTLGASASIFGAQAQGRPDPIVEHSRFTLVRITKKHSCEAILELFSDELKDLIQ